MSEQLEKRVALLEKTVADVVARQIQSLGELRKMLEDLGAVLMEERESLAEAKRTLRSLLERETQ